MADQEKREIDPVTFSDTLSGFKDAKNLFQYFTDSGRVAYDNPTPFIDAVIALSQGGIKSINEIVSDITSFGRRSEIDQDRCL